MSCVAVPWFMMRIRLEGKSFCPDVFLGFGSLEISPSVPEGLASMNSLKSTKLQFKKRTFYYASLAAMMLLAGCSGVAESLGFGRNSPDEFAVVDRPPLALPPDYTLRPPEPGAARPQEINLSDRAGMILYGANGAGANGTETQSGQTGVGTMAKDGAEIALLTAAGADKSEKDIRTKVDSEAEGKIAGSEHLVEDLLWWKKKETPAVTVDAVAEAARIRKAKEEGKPLDQGDTPIIEKQKSGWLGL